MATIDSPNLINVYYLQLEDQADLQTQLAGIVAKIPENTAVMLRLELNFSHTILGTNGTKAGFMFKLTSDYYWVFLQDSANFFAIFHTPSGFKYAKHTANNTSSNWS